MSDEDEALEVVVTASHECQAAVAETFKSGRELDFTVTAASITHLGRRAMVISWETVSAGFGELTFSRRDDGETEIDTEAMDAPFVKSVLCKLVDQAMGLPDEPTAEQRAASGILRARLEHLATELEAEAGDAHDSEVNAKRSAAKCLRVLLNEGHDGDG